MAINKDLAAGPIIEDMRIRSGLSLVQAEHMTGLSAARIKQLEGQTDCKLSTLAYMANAYGYTIKISRR